MGSTFALVCFAWIFFRANSLGDALELIGKMFVWLPGELDWMFSAEHSYNLLLAFLAITALILVQIFQEYRFLGTWITLQPQVVRWAIYLGLVSIILNFGEFDQQQFIYFQF